MMKAREIAKKVREGSLSAEAVVKESLAKIKELNPQINAFLEVFEEEALARAKAVDAKPAAQRGVLAGVPVALKDNINFKGHIMSCGSKMLGNYKAVYNASVVERLLAQDAVIIGRANMDEFAMGSTNEFSAWGPVKNPLDLTRVPGGSSGGSAAAVASGMVPVALGSDTGGSIRQPAAFCGVCGIKPTYGRVSRYGLTAFGSSLDQIGPITADIEDNALVLGVLSGKDENDSSCAPKPAFEFKKQDVKGLTVAVPTDFEGSCPEVKAAVAEAKEILRKAGVTVKDISLPHMKYSVPCYYIRACSEAGSNLARFDGLRYGYKTEGGNLDASYKQNRSAFGREVKRRIMIGSYTLSKMGAESPYVKSLEVSALITEGFCNVFKEVDALLIPSAPCTAFKFGELAKDPAALLLSDLFTVPANITGMPAVGVPFGKGSDNMPIGLQFYGDFFEENKIYSLAALLEK